MWLLDANMDVHLVPLLGELGVESDAATRRGWGSLDNAQLVSAAVGAGFTCLLTQDLLFAESAAHALKAFAQFSVVVVHLPQKPSREYREQFRSAWAASPIRPVPGRVSHWPSEPLR